MYRIIVPLDGSARSEQALPFGLVLADALRGKTTITQVVPRLDPPGAPEGGARETAKDYLQEIAAAQPTNAGIEAVVLEGEPATEILRLAGKDRQTIIVMSTHGRGGLGRLVFGSVADEVARFGAVSVALVRDGIAARPALPRTILVPVDGSPLAEQSLPLALDLAKRTGAALVLVRVVLPVWMTAAPGFAPEAAYLSSEQAGEVEQQGIDEARRHLDLLARRLRDQGARVTWEVRFGRPAEEIVRAADTIEPDLILISSHGRSGVRRWALGSVAQEILQRGHAPVLIVGGHQATSEQQSVEVTANAAH